MSTLLKQKENTGKVLFFTSKGPDNMGTPARAIVRRHVQSEVYRHYLKDGVPLGVRLQQRPPGCKLLQAPLSILQRVPL